MILEMRSRKVNGAGDIVATVAVMSDEGGLIWEDVVHLSVSKKREAFISEVAERAKISTERAREATIKLLADHRQIHLTEKAPEQSAGHERKSDKLVKEFIGSGVELFHDEVEMPYAAIVEGQRRAIYRVRSTALKDRLAFISFTKFGEAATSETISSAINVLAGSARYQGNEYPLSVRTAWHESAIYYDLGDWRAVRITREGWEVEERPPILFKRFSAQKEQVEPELGGDILDILPLINIQDEALQLLYVTDLVAGLIPGIPRPVSIFHGPQGSAKSTALRYKRALVDPSEVPFLTMPKDVDAFAQAGSHNLCLFYDNVTSLPQWLADCLSRFCTGDGSIKRTLFTDDDDFIFKSQGIGGLAGINLVVTQPDLLDRSLIYAMRRVTDSNRLEEKELDARFDTLKPKLLGAMFTALSAAMSTRELIIPTSLPRLADYAVWGCAVALGLGFSEEYYWNAIGTNVEMQSTEALEASPVAQTIVAFMQDKTTWQGPPSELYAMLNDIAESMGINTAATDNKRKKQARDWPTDAAWLTRKLNLVVPNLAQVGIIFETIRVDTRRTIVLRRDNPP